MLHDMTIETRQAEFNDMLFRCFIADYLQTPDEVQILAGKEHGAYFFGGVLDTGTALYAYFTNGPNQDALEQTVREKAGHDGVVHTCQIAVNGKTGLIKHVTFLLDPAKGDNDYYINENSSDSTKIRNRRVLALFKVISPKLFERNPVHVSWLDTFSSGLLYYPKDQRLFTNLK